MVLTVAGPPTHTSVQAAARELPFVEVIALYLHSVQFLRAQQAESIDLRADQLAMQPVSDEKAAAQIRDQLEKLRNAAARLREPAWDNEPLFAEIPPGQMAFYRPEVAPV